MEVGTKLEVGTKMEVRTKLDVRTKLKVETKLEIGTRLEVGTKLEVEGKCHGLNNHLSPALQLDYCSCRRPAMKVSRTWLVDITRSSKPLCCEVLPETVLRGQAKGTTEEGEAKEAEKEA